MSIHHEATIPADPARVYELLANADALSALSGKRGAAARSAGAEFAAFDGNVTGRQGAAESLSGVAFQLACETRFVESRANRQPALAVDSRDDTNGRWHGSGVLVVTLRGDRVTGLTGFESHTLRALGLPRVLPEHDEQG